MSHAPFALSVTSSLNLFVFFLAVPLILSSIHYYAKYWRRPPLPPGPPRSWIPFVGNTLQIWAYKKNFACLLVEWHKLYGDIFSYEVLGEVTIVICKQNIATELFERRGAIYSSRANLPLLRDFISRNRNLSWNLYDDVWRKLRRATHKELNVNQVHQYAFIQEREAHIMAQGIVNHLILKKPTWDGLWTVASRYGGSIAFGALYDHRVKVDNDPLVHDFDEALSKKMQFLRPGASLYDFLPWARWVPEWVMPTKRIARLAREEGEFLDSKLSKMVSDRLDAGEDTSSFHAGLLHREREGKAELSAFERDSLTGIVASAAIDTSISTTLWFIQALICWPDVQAKLQEEVDRVVGRDRMPTHGDLEHLPYTQAFVRESFRWQEVSPYVLPHAVTVDDVYKGHFIPKGSPIIGLNRALGRDPEYFPDPETLRPERWIDPKTGGINDLPVNSFGWGRRICPGRNLALSMTALVVATLTWSVTFSKAKDAQGRDIEIDTSLEAALEIGTIYRPRPFGFGVEIRHPAVQKIVAFTAGSYL